jgi:hypothetical protein
MASASMPATNRANYVTADHCGNRVRALRLNSSVMQKARDVFPAKTAHVLADITGYSLRSCEYWLSETTVIPSDALAALLHCDYGRSFLAAVMTDNTPRWWLNLLAWIQSIELAAAERKRREKFKELLDADHGSPSFAEMLQDEEFFGAQPSPARPRHRAVVDKDKRK